MKLGSRTTAAVVALLLGFSARAFGGAEAGVAAIRYSAELDITGPAAVPIFFELGDAAAVVRYVPCCNIYGGVLTVERGPDPPTSSGEGLPDRLYSSFVSLEPDAMTASTAGLYFQFTYDADVSGEVAAYEWRGGEWREMLSYDVDADARTVTFHCPDGGVFVLGAKAEAN